MGFEEREYFRGDSESPFQPAAYSAEGPWMMVTILVVINAVIFFANLLFTGESGLITYWLSVHDPETLTRPWLWWQFVTTGFAHADFSHILWNMLGFWILGRAVEMRYGREEILRIYLVTVVLGSVLWAVKEFFLPGQPMLLGASGAVTAIILLFCLLYPRTTILLFFVLPVPAWFLGALIIFGNVMQAFGDTRIAVDVHLVGAGFAILYFKFGWNLGRVLPGGDTLADPIGGVRRFFGRFKRRPKLKVHNPEVKYRALDAEADRILDKLHREGEASLTAKERRTLEDYSRRMRQKHR